MCSRGEKGVRNLFRADGVIRREQDRPLLTVIRMLGPSF
jgi:hypothetical protein